jgi:hypothetical protein
LLDHLNPTRPLQGQDQGGGKLYSAPSDNKCGSFGGCAVPISASQLYPIPDSSEPDQPFGTMELFNFKGETADPDRIPGLKGLLRYDVGDRVYDVAWKAYVQVLTFREQPIPDKPKDSELRLAFPPST